MGMVKLLEVYINLSAAFQDYREAIHSDHPAQCCVYSTLKELVSSMALHLLAQKGPQSGGPMS